MGEKLTWNGVLVSVRPRIWVRESVVNPSQGHVPKPELNGTNRRHP